jgi:ADP-L-glycero-D-manno-heptose 6-epimerase
MIVVTGGAGFIGSALVWALNKKGIDDIVIVDHFGEDEKYKNLVPLKFYDVFDRDDFGHIVNDGFFRNERVDIVYHLGACSSTTQQDVKFLFRNNYEYSKFLCQHCMENNVRFVYASSAATYGDGSQGYEDNESELEKLQPLNPYGYSKHLFDLWIKHNGLFNRVVGIKYFNVYGPNEYHKKDMRSIVYKCFYQIKETGKARLFKSTKPEYADGEQKRDFIYVKDAVDMTLFLGENREITGIFNVGTGNATSFNKIVSAIFKSLEKEPNIEYFDMPEILRGKYQDYTKANISKLLQVGYTGNITNVDDAVSDYVLNYLNTNNPYLK